MREICTSGLMSGDGKRGGAPASVLAPILDSTNWMSANPHAKHTGEVSVGQENSAPGWTHSGAHSLCVSNTGLHTGLLNRREKWEAKDSARPRTQPCVRQALLLLTEELLHPRGGIVDGLVTDLLQLASK